MMTILKILAIMVLASPLLADDKLPDGKLGHPVGTYLTIEGKRFEGRIKNDPKRVLLVEAVNGKKLSSAVTIEIENLGRSYLPANTRISIRGYESGRMVGMPYAVAKAEGTSLPQAGWHFYRYFIMTSSVKPEALPQEESKTNSYADRLRRRRSEERKRNVEPSTESDGLKPAP